MRFFYCPDCGSLLMPRLMGDEGEVPYCERCKHPFFDQFSTCVIALVVNDGGEAAILRQDYISQKYGNLVSGYMKPGETAEECARREIGEELGLEVDTLEFAATYWFGKKDMLMIGFFAHVSGDTLRLSGEVDGARWVPVADALREVHPEGSISYAVVAEYLKRHGSGNGKTV